MTKHSKRILHQKATWRYGSEKKEKSYLELRIQDGKSLKSLVEADKKKYIKEELFPLFGTAYFITKNDLALLDGEKLLNFLDL